MKLRSYQEEAVTAVLKDLALNKKTLLIMATGTGKTIVFAQIAKIAYQNGLKTLILAHTEELIDQSIEKAFNIVGVIPDKEKAEYRANKLSEVVVGSVMTMQGDRLKRWPKDHFQLIIVDEAHHAVAKSYQNILNYFEKYALLGVTATPDRADEKELGEVFDSIAYEYPLHKAIKDKYLVPIIGKRVTDFDIDLKDLKVSGKDYTDKELGLVMLKNIIPISNSIKTMVDNRKTLVFMPNVKSSAVLAEHLGRIGLNADYLSGERGKERSNILYRFKSGKIQVLVSCNILLEGFDEPGVETIVNVRPTTSRALYSQLVGRGTRLYPGKETLELIEFTYNYAKLKLVQPYELFASKEYDPRLRDKASSTTSEGVNLLATLDAAKTEWEKPENLSQRLITKEFGFQQFDPFAVAELFNDNISGEFDIEYGGRKLRGAITPGQIEILNRYGVNWSELNKAQASKLIDLYKQNGYIPMKDKATRNQKWFLTNNGYKYDKHIMKAQASIIIDMIKKGKIVFGE